MAVTLRRGNDSQNSQFNNLENLSGFKNLKGLNDYRTPKAGLLWK